MFSILRRLLVTIHLAVVVITVSHLHENINNRFFKPLNNLYSAYTNTNRCFGFFAPEVYNDLSLEIIEDNGALRKKYLFNNPNFETRVRYYSLMGHFGENYDTVQMSLFARSWALKVFTDDPQIKAIDVNVNWNNIPSMREYLKGRRIYPTLFYATHLEVD
jgi:hypothetical protein